MARVLTCAKCKVTKEAETMKYNLQGTLLICSDCSKKEINELKKPRVIERQVKQKANHFKFICYDCRYKFSLREDSRIPLSCPYCDKANIERDEINLKEMLTEL